MEYFLPWKVRLIYNLAQRTSVFLKHFIILLRLVRIVIFFTVMLFKLDQLYITCTMIILRFFLRTILSKLCNDDKFF